MPKFDKEFRLMPPRALLVPYGTAWDDCTLLERTKQTNLEPARRIRRHFQYGWQVVAFTIRPTPLRRR
jgi:hypothetical protein